MSLNNFIPSVWAGSLLVTLHKSLVFAQEGVINRDYQGEIKAFGDTVRINMIGKVTVNDYVKNTNMVAPETLTDAQTTLFINRAKYFNFQIDDVDVAQQNPKVMEQAMVEAAYALADEADQYVAGLYTDASSLNFVGTDAVPKNDLGTLGTAYQYLVDLGVKLDESNVPKSGRWAIVPPWFYGLLLKDDRFVKSPTPMGVAVLQNGVVGRAAGFDIMESNNAPNPTGVVYKIIGGFQGAITFADQLTEVDAYSPELRFADAVKGLHLYGAKVARPAGLAVLTANKP